MGLEQFKKEQGALSMNLAAADVSRLTLFEAEEVGAF
jgi:hypothetical protein